MLTRELVVTVHGIPAPKGSLRHVGHGRLIEQVKGSAPWRYAVTVGAAQERDRHAWGTLEGPVEVVIRVRVARPKTVKRDHPTTRSSGDADKHARNVLDALVDAHIIGDDSQVTELHITKEYAATAGATITIRPAHVNRQATL